MTSRSPIGSNYPHTKKSYRCRPNMKKAISKHDHRVQRQRNKFKLSKAVSIIDNVDLVHSGEVALLRKLCTEC